MSDEKALVKSEQPEMQMARYNWTGLSPQQMKGIAQAMAMSGMFPDIQKDSAKAFVKIMAGQEMGIPPFQAMSDISIIQGKASAGGNIYASKVKGHPKYDYKIKNWTNKGCAIEFFQIENGKPVSLGVSQFDENDARTAGLLGKGNWKTYPRNMYFNRAMTAGVRTYTPDALGGINAYTPEELGANVDHEGNFVSMDEPKKPLQASNPQKTVEKEVTEPENTDEAPVDNPVDNMDNSDDEVEITEDNDVQDDTAAAFMDDQLPVNEDGEMPDDFLKVDEDPKSKRPPYGPKTDSNLARPEQRKYYKQLLADHDIQAPEAKQVAQQVLHKNGPATYDDFEAIFNFIETGEIPEQGNLIKDEK